MSDRRSRPEESHSNPNADPSSTESRCQPFLQCEASTESQQNTRVLPQLSVNSGYPLPFL
jgi:hypothetical protein